MYEIDFNAEREYCRVLLLPSIFYVTRANMPVLWMLLILYACKV